MANGLIGFELLGPAAITILGGLVTATLVNVFILPVMVLRFGSGPDRDSWIDDLYEPTPEAEPVQA